MNPLFDIACNFSSSRFDKDLDQVISRALENNVKKFLVTCSSIYDIEKVYNIYHEHNDKTFFTIGIHPHNAKEVNKKTIIAMKEISEKIDANFIVVNLDWAGSLKKENYKNFFKKNKINFVNCAVPLDKKFAIPGDYHTNKEAHTFYKNCLVNYFDKQKLL